MALAPNALIQRLFRLHQQRRVIGGVEIGDLIGNIEEGTLGAKLGGALGHDGSHMRDVI